MKGSNSSTRVKMENWQFQKKLKLPYKEKLKHARQMAVEFYDAMEGEVYVAVGGLDSITLLYFVRECVKEMYLNRDRREIL